MSEAKPTPGPWKAERIDNSSCFDIKCECGFFIATCHDGVRGESNAIANARLIAAAPELLEALKACAAVCTGATMNKRGLISALEQARAALAKCEGVKP